MGNKLVSFEANIFEDQREYIAAVKRHLRVKSNAEALRQIIEYHRKSAGTPPEVKRGSRVM